MCEDLDLWRRISKSYKVKCISEYLTIVRTRDNHFDPGSYFEKRKVFLEKAISDDLNLDKKIVSKLFLELYCVYLLSGCPFDLIAKDLGVTLQKYPQTKEELNDNVRIILKNVLNDPLKKIRFRTIKQMINILKNIVLKS
jgi:hypothetical protein